MAGLYITLLFITLVLGKTTSVIVTGVVFTKEFSACTTLLTYEDPGSRDVVSYVGLMGQVEHALNFQGQVTWLLRRGRQKPMLTKLVPKVPVHSSADTSSDKRTRYRDSMRRGDANALSSIWYVGTKIPGNQPRSLLIDEKKSGHCPLLNGWTTKRFTDGHNSLTLSHSTRCSIIKQPRQGIIEFLYVLTTSFHTKADQVSRCKFVVI
ncbi:hypothetical protein VNO77_03637 [Canavalia gladiata]|uniref:Uncharacterized protein n=1 Tax=Canavalia gladiata TaxID=3824 RepID=A0AAN9N077_CANGL